MNSTPNCCFRLLIGILCLIALPLQAQQNNSLYFMTGLPQSSQLNPATQPKCGFFLTLPSIEINAGNSAVGFNDVFIYKPQLDSMVLFMYDQGTRSNFLNKFSKNNNLSSEVRVDLFSLGFRISNTYLSFGVGMRAESRSVIPYDLVRFIMLGNINSVGDSLNSFNFKSFGTNAMYYNEYALGISHEFNSKLTFGLKAKLLYGIANLTTSNSEFSMNGTGGLYKLHSVMDIRSSIPNLDVYTGTNGQLDSLKFNEIKDANQARSILTNTKNMGLAFDVGVVYKPIEKISLSLSLLDLGYIKWKDNLHSFTQDTTYDFKGVIVNPNSGENSNTLIDSLKNNFTYKKNLSPYTTALSAKLYVGALYQLTKGIGLGVLTRQQIIDKNLYSQYTFSLNLYPANAFNFTLAYTIADKMYDNFGFGMSFKLAFLQTYIMSERIPLYWNKDKKTGAPFPAYAKNFNMRFGFNIVLGYNHRAKKLKGDKPLLDL
jgi:hypothetical protein